MSVLRAILGRFARFLVRIARRLDPAITPAAAWPMMERMAALRQRYPGAPDHWLELVARRASFEAAPPPEAEDLPASPPANVAHFPVAAPAQKDISVVAPSRPAARPRIAFFRRSDAKPRPAIQAVPGRPAARAELPPAVADPRAARPAVTFAPRHLRNPIARLLKLDRPKPRRGLLQFEIADDRRPGIEPPPAADPEPIRRFDRPVFPAFETRTVPRPTWSEPDDAPPRTGPDLRWPALRSTKADPTWPDQPQRDRPDQTFGEIDSRWPELPALSDDSGAPLLSSRDEAALRAEQLGGTWSA